MFNVASTHKISSLQASNSTEEVAATEVAEIAGGRPARRLPWQPRSAGPPSASPRRAPAISFSVKSLTKRLLNVAIVDSANLVFEFFSQFAGKILSIFRTNM